MPVLDLVTMAWVETGSTWDDKGEELLANIEWDELALWERLLDKKLCVKELDTWLAGTEMIRN